MNTNERSCLTEQFRMVDLTQSLTSDAATWNGSCGFCSEIKKDYDQLFRVEQLKLHAGVGTHMDAPSHRFKGGACISALPLDQFLAKACIINVADKAHADYEVSLQDIADYEARSGKIPNKAFVIAYTGWSRFWNNPRAYRNEDEKRQMHFPAFSLKAVEKLMSRNIVGIGIDTLSPDCLDLNFPVHQLVLGAGKYIVENIADCSEVPSKGTYVLALPLKIDCTESPMRMIALIPN